MTPRELIEAFGTLAEAPDGVKRLRELVLQLAVRGKLVPQVEGEESAGRLLERIANDSARIGKATRAFTGAKLQGEPNDVAAPASWAWCKLDDIIDPLRPISYGVLVPGAHENAGIPLVRVAELHPRHPVPHPEKSILASVAADYSRIQLQGDELLLGVVGSIGKVGVAHPNWAGAVIARAVARIAVARGILRDFVLLLLQAPITQAFFHGSTRTLAQPTLNVSLIRQLPVALPPLAEQHRIVAKVDELMAFLDKLEAAKTARDTTRKALRDAALAALREADSPDDVELAWGRIAEQMDDLFAEPEDVAPLRQAVLQLAVRGRLVRQVEGDEPAGRLLERLWDARNSGQPSKAKVRSAIGEVEQLFSIPDSWCWTHLDRVCDVRDGTHATPKYVTEGVPLVTSKNLSSGKLELANTSRISLEDHAEISKRSKVLSGDILFAMIGSIGNPVRVETDVAFSIKNVALFKPFDSSLLAFDYLMIYLRLSSKWMRDAAAGGVQQFIALGQLRSFPIPLPPLAEQHRIVAKVDELMALLDSLESRLREAKRLQAAFAAAAVHHLEPEVAA